MKDETAIRAKIEQIEGFSEGFKQELKDLVAKENKTEEDVDEAKKLRRYINENRTTINALDWVLKN
jgi:C4-type Zn-finger protein